MSRLTTILLLLLIWPSGGLLAQGGGTFVPGDQVRLRAEAQRGVYTVVEYSAPTLTLRGNAGENIQLPVSDIERLDLRVGPRSRMAGAGNGIWKGALIGGVPGAILGFSGGDDPPGWFALTAGEKALILGISFGVMGGAVGGVIGAVSPGSRWQRVVPGTRLGFSPTGTDGAVLVVSRSF